MTYVLTSSCPCYILTSCLGYLHANLFWMISLKLRGIFQLTVSLSLLPNCLCHQSGTDFHVQLIYFLRKQQLSPKSVQNHLLLSNLTARSVNTSCLCVFVSETFSLFLINLQCKIVYGSPALSLYAWWVMKSHLSNKDFAVYHPLPLWKRGGSGPN